MIDYRNLNVKIGLEIHQELNTNKLFCHCPSVLQDEIIKRIKRKLRSSAGETGKLDIAAKYEIEKDKTIYYDIPKDSCCLVELDEQPPNPINEEALDIALQIALLLDADVLDKIFVMRKVVVDGSNPTGFQRTALIAINGKIETSKGIVNIPGIYLEEESARIVEQSEKHTVYNLDRLGIPLIEISTAPDIKDAEHAIETASLLGMILRSTGKVKRGLGTIRQDINLSIKSQPKIEIKGFQDLRSMPVIIENEIKRLSELKHYLSEVRKVNEDSTTAFLRPMPGADRMYPETDIPIITITKERIANIKLPELLTAKVLRLEKDYKLNQELAREVISEDIDIDYYINEYKNIDATLIVRVLISIPKEIKSRFNLDISKIKEDDYNLVLENLNKNNIAKESVMDIFVNVIKGHKININDYKPISKEELEHEIKEFIAKNKDIKFNIVMQHIMQKHKGKIDAKIASELINKNIKS